jgi:cobalt transporter subunit CbtA
MFRRIFITALVTGTLAGLLLTAVQRLQVIPIIFEAETYEDSAPSSAVDSTHDTGHQHAADSWKPKAGIERTFYTTLSNIFGGIGFALVLAGAIFLSGRNGWRYGLLWGFAGYLVFFVAPSLGLHPEIPGTQSANVIDRQLWWIATVAATASGMALVIFNRSSLYKGIGVLLIVIPHLIGAPLTEQPGSVAPSSLAISFILATAISNGFYWLVLGGISGYFLRNQNTSTQAGAK